MVAIPSVVLMKISCSSSNSSIEELPYLTVKSVSPQNLAAAGGEITIRVSSYPVATAQSNAGLDNTEIKYFFR